MKKIFPVTKMLCVAELFIYECSIVKISTALKKRAKTRFLIMQSFNFQFQTILIFISSPQERDIRYILEGNAYEFWNFLLSFVVCVSFLKFNLLLLKRVVFSIFFLCDLNATRRERENSKNSSKIKVSHDVINR